MTKNNSVGIGIICGVVIIALGSYFLVKQKTMSPPPEVTDQTIPSSISQPVTNPTSTLVNDLRQGGSSFADPKGVFAFLYPNDYKIDSQNNGQYTRIYKTGATQRGQTEMYDGIIVNFESVSLGSSPLEQWVDAQIKTSTADGTSEVIAPKKALIHNGYPGFTYSLRGLGTAKYIVLQKNAASKNAVSITYSVMDPENVGYQTEVDAILGTLELLK